MQEAFNKSKEDFNVKDIKIDPIFDHLQNPDNEINFSEKSSQKLR